MTAQLPCETTTAACATPTAHAIPITPPRLTKGRNAYECNIEHNGQLYRVVWSGSQEYPDLSLFPNIPACKLFLIAESTEILRLKNDSTFLTAGAHASVRRLDTMSYPIVKLAHPDDFSMSLIQYDYEILKQLSQLDLPLPTILEEPILHDSKICGFRMEELRPIGYQERQEFSSGVRDAIAKLHQAGYSHGDISPSNVMKDQQGCVVLINLSFSGLLGERVPSWFPDWVYDGLILTEGTDMKRLKEYWV